MKDGRMTRNVRVGWRLPPVQLAIATGEGLELIDLDRKLAGRRVILVGLPGAFTPVCTGLHLPELVAAAPRLRASGFDEVICIAPNSPWVMREWAERTDPEGRLTFLSDGNLELANAAGLTTTAPQFFLGRCSKRFTMVLRNAIVGRLAIEARLDAFGCTRPTAFIDGGLAADVG
jgi:peroxiredoxin